MTGPRLVLVLASILLIASATYDARDAGACAGVGRAGRVSVRGEEALIVWDEARQIEHFIRRAYFDGQREDFGFLVPTPTQPELSEESVAVFTRLFQLYRAPVRRDAHARSRSTSGGGGGAMASADVLVLEETTVAGMDAAVLQASDAGALDGWLRAHGYPNSPALTAYVQPYVDAHWIVTAFRISPSGTASFTTSAVRMTFSTPRPFFPYSEPTDFRIEPRQFRVSIAAPRRMAAFLDRPAGGAREAWRQPSYAGRPAGIQSALAQSLPPASPEGARTVAGPWLTTFDEPDSQRGTRDLFFERDRSQRAVTSRITRPVRR